MSDLLFQQKFCGTAAGYTNHSQQTSRQALRNGPISGLKTLGYRPGQNAWSCRAGSLKQKKCWRSQMFFGWELAYL